MRKVVISFSGVVSPVGLPDFPFTHKYYMPVYQAFIELCAANGIEARVSYTGNYIGKSTFSQSYLWKDGSYVLDSTPYTAEAILIRGATLTSKLDGSENTVNPPIIFACEDKLATYQRFGNHMAATLLLSPTRWEEQLTQIPGSWIVCKPVNGWGGKDIWIGDKSQFKLPPNVREGDYIIQEFLDTSHGIPGLVKGVHDLRIIVSGNHEPLSYIRSPKQGSLLANLSQGGSAIALERNQIPEDALAIALEVEKALVPTVPHFICVDFLYDATGKVRLCEISSRPGFSYPEGEGPEFAAMYRQTLLTVLQEALALTP